MKEYYIGQAENSFSANVNKAEDKHTIEITQSKPSVTGDHFLLEVDIPVSPVEKAIADIYEWKSHILRSKNQEKQVNCLGENEAFMVADWAMKFLPRKFREGQTDWFGKRGINWHIAVTMLKTDMTEGSVKFLTHVHIFEQPNPQDAATTAYGAILVDVVQNIPSVKKAIDSQQRGQYRVKVISPVINADDEKVSLRSIPLISMLHNFKFTDNGLQVWRAYDIGQDDGGDDDEEDDNDDNDNDDEDTQNDNYDKDTTLTEPVPKKRRTIAKIFTCPEEGCTCSFKHSSSLDKHILLGNCNMKEEKLSLADRTKVLYAQKLENGNLGVSFTKQPANNNNTATDKLNKGWALKVNKPKTIFTQDQKAYLHEKFMIGKTTGRKEDPSKVAEEMRYALKNGENRFSRSQYLTSQQVASYFSRLVQKEKKIDETDLIAATADSKCSVLKRNVLKECSL
ncbi:unnamed protein product [Mytilus coruscus]|uniref:C2H2-type domain-containing protein n=1 Tax=Mytilus coruscus TaxID=42192 RepID=A0A6J8ECS8_MYTCO|nr:unnamed protein product [Mytilus coruscus]